MLGAWHPEIEFLRDAQRSRQLVLQDPRDRLTGDPANDLADDVAERVGVVADLRPRLPPQLGVGDRRAHLVPVAEVFDSRGQRDPRDARGVVQDVANRNGGLAPCAELGPHLGDLCLVVESSALGEHMHQRGRRCLADRIAVDRRFGAHSTAGRRIGKARHCIHDLHPAVVNGDL